MADDGPRAGGPEFKIRPGDLKAASPTFQAQSKALKDALDTLRHNLAGAGSPWGDDKQGKEFAQAYNGPHDHVLSALDILVKGLTSIHDGLNAHADADNHVRMLTGAGLTYGYDATFQTGPVMPLDLVLGAVGSATGPSGKGVDTAKRITDPAIRRRHR